MENVLYKLKFKNKTNGENMFEWCVYPFEYSDLNCGTVDCDKRLLKYKIKKSNSITVLEYRKRDQGRK